MTFNYLICNRDRLLSGASSPGDAFVVLNGDVCADFPLGEMLRFHEEADRSPVVTMLATEATKQQAMNYGCVVEDRTTHEVLHYVEKPATYTSSLINCGVYVCSAEVFGLLGEAYKRKQASQSGADQPDESLWIESDVLPALAGAGRARVFTTERWWTQVKTAGGAIYANRHYLALYEKTSPQRLMKCGGDGEEGPQVLGNVFAHPSAKIHPTAVLGPNVSIGPDANVGAGARLRECILLDGACVGEHSLVMYAVVGLHARVGRWSRLEGTPNDPNPDRPFAKMDNAPLFNAEGKLNPSIAILGDQVDVPPELVLRNVIVLPHKQISHSVKNEIIL